MKKILLLIIIFSIFSCKKFDNLEVYIEKDQLFFSSNEMLSICDAGLVVSDFSVNFISEDNTQSIAWQIEKDNFPKKNSHQLDFPLKYGVSIKGVSTKSSPISLKPGIYSYGGTIYCQKGKEETGFDVLGKFEITNNNTVSIH